MKQYRESFAGRWPRRSREAVFRAMTEGIPSPNFPLSDTEELAELQAEVREISAFEADQTRQTG